MDVLKWDADEIAQGIAILKRASLSGAYGSTSEVALGESNWKLPLSGLSGRSPQ